MEIFAVTCKGKTYEVNSQELDHIERMVEKAEGEIRDRLTSAAHERFEEKRVEQIEEDLRKQYDGILYGAALDRKIEKAKREAWQEIEADLENEIANEIEDYRESLLSER